MTYSDNTEEEYFGDSSLHGKYQYTSLKEVVDSFMMIYVGSENYIKNISKYKVKFHAKRGIQELSYDLLKDVKVMELTVNPDTLSVIMPKGYVSWVRISQVDDYGNFLPLLENRETSFGDNYLQDNEYNFLYDNDGNILRANENSYDPTNVPNNPINSQVLSYNRFYSENGGTYPEGGLFWLDATKANTNGWFNIDKRSGVIRMSSEIANKDFVLEYISDGLDYLTDAEIMVHKHAVQVLYAYIEWNIIASMDGIPEYVVRRKQLDYKAKYNNSAIRKMNLNTNDLIQSLRGRNNWIK